MCFFNNEFGKTNSFGQVESLLMKMRMKMMKSCFPNEKYNNSDYYCYFAWCICHVIPRKLPFRIVCFYFVYKKERDYFICVAVVTSIDV